MASTTNVWKVVSAYCEFTSLASSGYLADGWTELASTQLRVFGSSFLSLDCYIAFAISFTLSLSKAHIPSPNQTARTISHHALPRLLPPQQARPHHPNSIRYTLRTFPHLHRHRHNRSRDPPRRPPLPILQSPQCPRRLHPPSLQHSNSHDVLEMRLRVRVARGRADYDCGV